jgi:hypothetical protein
MTSTSHWLMKAEPESRLEKGVDVKVSFATFFTRPSLIECPGSRNVTSDLVCMDTICDTCLSRSSRSMT